MYTVVAILRLPQGKMRILTHEHDCAAKAPACVHLAGDTQSGIRCSEFQCNYLYGKEGFQHVITALPSPRATTYFLVDG